MIRTSQWNSKKIDKVGKSYSEGIKAIRRDKFHNHSEGDIRVQWKYEFVHLYSTGSSVHHFCFSSAEIDDYLNDGDTGVPAMGEAADSNSSARGIVEQSR